MICRSPEPSQTKVFAIQLMSLARWIYPLHSNLIEISTFQVLQNKRKEIRETFFEMRIRIRSPNWKEKISYRKNYPTTPFSMGTKEQSPNSSLEKSESDKRLIRSILNCVPSPKGITITPPTANWFKRR